MAAQIAISVPGQITEENCLSETFWVQFIYTPENPYAITLAFPKTPSQDLPWTMALCLFTEAIATGEPQGLGDVRLTPAYGPNQLGLLLVSRENICQVVLDCGKVKEAITLIESAVPPAHPGSNSLYDPAKLELILQRIAAADDAS